MLKTILTLAFIVILIIVIDLSFYTKEYHYGKVIGKHYVAETNSTGTGIGVLSNGGAGVVITSEYSPAKFLLAVETEKGKIFTVKCYPKSYYRTKIGERIRFVVEKGYITRIKWIVKEK